MATDIYFVRHGQSDSNLDGVVRGEHASLTDHGKGQAETVADRIVRLGVDAILASSYPRAIETAKPAADKLGLVVEPNPLFCELRRPSSHVGRRHDDPEYAKEVARFFSSFGTDAYDYEDGESFEAFRARTLDALVFLKDHRAERVCVVSHGIFLRALFCAAVLGPAFTGEEFSRMWHLHINNTGITHLRWNEAPGKRDHGWQIVTWNDSAHLG